jgi:hypothetical protein
MRRNDKTDIDTFLSHSKEAYDPCTNVLFQSVVDQKGKRCVAFTCTGFLQPAFSHRDATQDKPLMVAKRSSHVSYGSEKALEEWQREESLESGMRDIRMLRGSLRL